jgi:adenine phosphoribosyltransferase
MSHMSSGGETAIAAREGRGIDSSGTDPAPRHVICAPLEPHVIIKSTDELRALIREVPDFPKPGILFYDITTLLKVPDAFRSIIDHMVDQVKDTKIDIVVGMESRGFIFSAPMAYQLNAGFVPVRKLGKLPAETIEVEYELEYGTATLEIHRDAIEHGQRVLIVDDLLATGGTVMGTIELVRRLGGEIAGLSFMVELTGLNGRAKLDEFKIFTLLTY